MGFFDFLKGKKKKEEKPIEEELQQSTTEDLEENELESNQNITENNEKEHENGLSQGIQTTIEKGEEAVEKLADQAGSVINNLAEEVTEKVNQGMERAESKAETAEKKVQAGIETVKDEIKTTAETVKDEVKATVEQLSEVAEEKLVSKDKNKDKHNIIEEATGTDEMNQTNQSSTNQSENNEDEISVETEDNAPEVVEEKPVKKGFFSKLVEGLSKTRDHVMQGVNDVLSGFSSIDEDFYEELEEALIIGDLGVNTAIKIVAGLKEKVKQRHIKDPQAVKELLKEELKEQMQTTADAYDFIQKKTVLLVIGVNGVGKTTTIGKLASQYKKQGKKVMLAAADTFRAAAIDQLKEWATRSDVPIIAQAENSDPGAVIYDAIASAKSKDVDILICDTAGRLHNKKNLMAELGKIYRIIGREYPDAHLEVFLVLDSTTGQNALVQAKEFKEMADITGIVLTKLDGTSKGGIAIAISADLKLPVKYIGVGEGIDDLRPFDANNFIDALFDEK